MKKLLFLMACIAISIPSAHAYGGGWNGNYRPYYRPYTPVYYNNGGNYWGAAAAGLVVGAALATAVNQPRYVAPPAPVYVAPPVYSAAPVYAPPSYPQGYVTATTYVPAPAPRPYQPQATVLYFCGANGLYYPQTPSCPTSWQVLPNY